MTGARIGNGTGFDVNGGTGSGYVLAAKTAAKHHIQAGDNLGGIVGLVPLGGEADLEHGRYQGGGNTMT